VTVGDRQRVDPALVLGAKPALEVGRPFLVGRFGRDRPRRRIERPAPTLDRFNLRMSPIVEAAGQSLCASRAVSFAKSLRGPRWGNRRRSADTSSSIASAVRCGYERVACESAV
jgi:hypothetical protein